MNISESKKKEGRFCCAYGCKNKPEKRKGMLCHKHYARKLREENPKQGVLISQYQLNGF